MCGCPKYLSYPVIFMVLNLSPVLETWSLPVANLPADNLPAATFQQHNLPTVNITQFIFLKMKYLSFRLWLDTHWCTLKILLNLPRIYEKLPWKEETYWFSRSFVTDRQSFCYFIIRIPSHGRRGNWTVN